MKDIINLFFFFATAVAIGIFIDGYIKYRKLRTMVVIMLLIFSAALQYKNL